MTDGVLVAADSIVSEPFVDVTPPSSHVCENIEDHRPYRLVGRVGHPRIADGDVLESVSGVARADGCTKWVSVEHLPTIW